MANISDTKGIIELEGNWEEKEINLLAEYLKGFDRAGGDYGIEFYDWPGDKMSIEQLFMRDKSYGFYGNGRWSMHYTIRDMFERQKVNSAKLAKAMKDKDLYFKISYLDLEPGAMFILQCIDVFSVYNDELHLTQDCEELPYTIATLMDEGFWEEDDLFNSMDNAFDGFLIKEGKDRMEFLVKVFDIVYEKLLDKIHPYPYYYTIDDVPAELQDLVKEYCNVKI